MSKLSFSQTQHLASRSREIDNPYNMHPLVSELFATAHQRGVSIPAIAARAGFAPKTLYDWRTRTNPTVPNLEACLNVLGLELAIREREQ